jgi:plasmid stability protein
MTDEGLPASEAARARRRDRDMEAERRALLRPGLAKSFRQLTEAAAKPPKPKRPKAKKPKAKRAKK